MLQTSREYQKKLPCVGNGDRLKNILMVATPTDRCPKSCFQLVKNGSLLSSLQPRYSRSLKIEGEAVGKISNLKMK